MNSFADDRAVTNYLDKHLGDVENLITLSVLVQNRGKEPVLVFAGQSVLLGTDYGADYFKEWKGADDDSHEIVKVFIPGMRR